MEIENHWTQNSYTFKHLRFFILEQQNNVVSNKICLT